MMDVIIASYIGTLLALATFAVPVAVVVKQKLKNFNPLGGLNQ